jgi:hypothetical protein
MKFEADTTHKLIIAVCKKIKSENNYLNVNQPVVPVVPMEFFQFEEFPELVMTKTGTKEQSTLFINKNMRDVYGLFINGNPVGGFSLTDPSNVTECVTGAIQQMVQGVFDYKINEEVKLLIEQFNLNRIAKDDRIGVVLEAIKIPGHDIEIIYFKLNEEVIWSQPVPYGGAFNIGFLPTIVNEYRQAAMFGKLGYSFPEKGEYQRIAGYNNVQPNHLQNAGHLQPLNPAGFIRNPGSKW